MLHGGGLCGADGEDVEGCCAPKDSGSQVAATVALAIQCTDGQQTPGGLAERVKTFLSGCGVPTFPAGDVGNPMLPVL